MNKNHNQPVYQWNNCFISQYVIYSWEFYFFCNHLYFKFIFPYYNIFYKKLQMERVSQAKLQLKQFIFQAAFLIQQQIFDRYWAIILIFVIEFILGANAFLLVHIELNTTFQKYLKNIVSINNFKEQNILLISLAISIIILVYLFFSTRISLKGDKMLSFGKWINQDMVLLMMVIITYLLNVLLLWMLNFAVYCILSSFSTANIYFCIVLRIFGVLQFGFSITFCYFYEVILITMSFKNGNLMLKYSNTKSFYFRLINFMGVILITSSYEKSSMIQIVSTSLIFISYLYQIYQEVCTNKYHNQFTKTINQIVTISNFYLSMLIVIQVTYPLDLIQNNKFTLFIISTIFSVIALNIYQIHTVNSVIISEISQFKALYQIRLYFQCFLRLIRGQQSRLQVIKLSLLEKHRMNCKNITCQCRDKKLEMDQRIKGVAYQKWKLIDSLFCKDQHIILLGKFFVFQCFEHYPLIVAYLEASSDQQCSLQFEYLKYHLKMSILTYVQKVNDEKDLAETQAPIVLQKNIDEIFEKMKKCSNSFFQKYKYLCKGLCRITQIEQANLLQLKTMRQIQQIYQEHKNKYKKSIEFSLVLYFFFSKIFILNIRANDIRRHLTNQRFQLNLINDSKTINFKNSIFNNNCCTFESNFADKNYGLIRNVSKNVTKMFGGDRTNFIGRNINKIFPSFLRQEHDKIVTNWYDCGRWDKIGALKQAFCVDQHGKHFSCIVYLKISISFDNELRFYAMVMKNTNDSILLLNQNQQIEDYGDKIKQLLCFDARKYPVDLIFVDFTDIELYEKQHTEIKLSIRGFKDAENKFLIENSPNFRQKIQKNKEFLNSTNINKQFGMGIIQHQCRFAIKKNYMGSKQFLSLQMLNLIQNGYTKSILYLSNAESVFQGSNLCFSKSVQDQEQQRIQQIACESSVNSSQNSDNYSIVKVIKTYFHLFLQSNQIKSRRINLTTYFILFFVFLIIGQIIGIHYFYLIGLNSVYEVCFADGAVSDNMQLFQFLYGNTMLMKQFQNDTAGLQLIHNSSKDMENYVYRLLSYDIQYLFKDVVELSNLKYYEYLKFPVEWKFSQVSTQIQSNQFLQYFYYMARQSWKTKPSQHILNSFMKNFPEMKRINHQNLQFYGSQTLTVISQLTIIFYLNIATLLIFSIGFGFTMHYFYFKKYGKMVKSSQIYSQLSQQQLEQLKEYYAQINQYLIKTIKTKNMGPEDFNYPISKGNKTISSKLNIINNKKYLSFIWILIFIVALNTINLFSNLETHKMFDPSKEMVVTMSQLMDSENYLIQSYFQMKAHFIIGNQSKTINRLADQLLQRIQYDQLLFNTIVKHSLKLFKKYDPTYESDFINLLIDNTCQIIDNNITDFQRWKCKFDIYENMIDLGVIGGMNQFYRQVQNSLHMMKTIDISSFDYDSYFKSKTIRETDKNIFFMFKMYQTTQQRIMQSLETLISDDFRNRFIWLILETVIMLMITAYWMLNIPTERADIGNLYGSFLLIPQGVIGQSKNILKKIDEIMRDQ